MHEFDPRPQPQPPAAGSGALTGKGRMVGPVALQTRHADYLEQLGKLEGRTPEQMLERLVRIAYQEDRAGIKTNVVGPQSFSGRAGELKTGAE